ncbi:MAG: universal stress protein [Methylotenera sp.]|nr:universal stress protein [Oligoflexia bacterium]
METGPEVVMAMENFKPAAQAAMDNFIAHLDFSDRLLPSKVLIQPAATLRKSVDTLLRYARKERVALIALTTHARTGAVRLIQRSFTEHLMQHSLIPLLVAGPGGSLQQRPGGTRFKTVVAPIDFGRHGASTVLSSIALAKHLSARLSFFHVDQVNSLPPLFSDGLVPIHPDLSRIFCERVELHHHQLQEWVNFAALKGVEADYAISENLGGSVAHEILAFARSRESPLTQLCAERGSLTSLLFGSITREVLRHSESPCLITHPKLIPATCELTSLDPLKKAA